MPLPMVHLAAARLLTQTFDIANEAVYMLGSIAPDAVHMRENFRAEWKLASHLRDTAESPKELVLERAIDMICNADCAEHRDFCIGYGVHVATDMIWNRTIFADFKEAYENAGLDPDERKNVYYNDTDRLDFELFDRMPWRAQVWKELTACVSVGMHDLVTAGEVERWKQRTLHWFDAGESQHKEPIWYFTREKLLGFVEDAADEIAALVALKHYRDNPVTYTFDEVKKRLNV